jgi:predicted GNAT family N-acyltransferase
VEHFDVRVTDWAADSAALRAVRRAVFIIEQGVPESLEWDEFDPRSVHALAVDPHARAIGCGRLLPDGHIGRMAVLADWRGRGVGAALLFRLVELAREAGHSRAILNAQISAMPFYARYGFTATGEAFEEAGILHRIMDRSFR